MREIIRAKTEDLKAAICTGARTPIAPWTYYNSYGIDMSAVYNEFSRIYTIKNEKIVVPAGLVTGTISFMPMGIYNMEEHEDEAVEIFIYAVKGLSQFVTDMEKERRTIPALLHSRTNERTARFARRLGFYVQKGENGSVVIGATNTVLYQAKKLGENQALLRRLERRRSAEKATSRI